ncbi:MAG: hypothetical protein JWR73_3377 [Tardiphaga sp.]|nr:hypothetical protein [Tardiphaga sp.]
MTDNKLNDPSHTPLNRDLPAGHSTSHSPRLDGELQVDPELKEGPASSGRMVMFGAAIVVVLGMVFYGLNNSAKAPDGTSATASQSTPAAQTGTNKAEKSAAPNQSAPARPSAPNSAVGTTTGSAAPTNTQQPRSAPTGTEVDQDKSSSSNKSGR